MVEVAQPPSVSAIPGKHTVRDGLFFLELVPEESAELACHVALSWEV